MITAPPGKFVPLCAAPECGAQASYGYGCTREIGSGTWYCLRHRPSDEAPAVHPDGASQGLPSAALREGRLF